MDGMNGIKILNQKEKAEIESQLKEQFGISKILGKIFMFRPSIESVNCKPDKQGKQHCNADCEADILQVCHGGIMERSIIKCFYSKCG